MRKIVQKISANPPNPGSPVAFHSFPYSRFPFAASFIFYEAARSFRSARALPAKLAPLAETPTLSSGEAF